MADFKETLEVRIYKNQFGVPSITGRYCFCHAKQDLADNTVQICDLDDNISLGEACKIIDDFCGSSLEDRKLNLRAFMENDGIILEEEY